MKGTGRKWPILPPAANVKRLHIINLQVLRIPKNRITYRYMYQSCDGKVVKNADKEEGAQGDKLEVVDFK